MRLAPPRLLELALLLAGALASGCVVWDSRVGGLDGAPVGREAGEHEAGEHEAGERAEGEPASGREPVPEATSSAPDAGQSPAEGEDRPATEGGEPANEASAGAEPAPAAEAERAASHPEPEVVRAGEAPPAQEPSASSLTQPSESLASEREPGELVLGAPVVSAAGELVATVEDLWLAPASGRLVGVLARHPAGAREGAQVVYDPACVVWVGPTEEPRLLLLDNARGDDAKGVLERASLFAARKLETVEGEVVDVDEGRGCPACASRVRVRDSSNVHHLVLLEPAPPVNSLLADLKPGVRVVVEGVPTRDEAGRVWIAGSIRFGRERVRLRGEDGRPALATIARGTLSARALLAARARTQDGAELALSGFTLERAGGRISELRLRHGALERLVPWEVLRPTEGGLALALNETELVGLPYRTAPAASAAPALSEPE